MAGLLNVSSIPPIIVEFVIEVEESDLVAGFKFRDFPVEREKGIHSGLGVSGDRYIIP
jgi:hypothetical protein